MKRILFLSCLFVILQSSIAFCSLSVNDYKQMEIEGKEPSYNEITQDQTSYENWVSYVNSKTDSHYDLPDFSLVASLTKNLLAYSVGNYADVASGVLDNLGDYFTLGSDIWNFMTFNVQRMAFDYAPDFVRLLKIRVDEEIYTSGSVEGPVVGNWYSVPWSFVGGSSTWNVTDVSSNSAPVYVCLVDSGWDFGIYLASFVNSQSAVISSSTGVNSVLTTGNRYQGSVSVGFWQSYGMSGAYRPSNVTMYSSRDSALADLFGQEWTPVTPEPVLNGKGIIVNENPTINPVTLTSALGYPFAQTLINNYNNNTPMPWRPNIYNYVDYNYGYEVPFWQGQELQTLEYPSAIEFPSVEFETVAVDSNIDTAIEGLSGWIIEFLLIAILLLVLGLII